MSDNPYSDPRDPYQNQSNADYSPYQSNIDDNRNNEPRIFQCLFGPPVNGNKEDTEKLVIEQGFSGFRNLQVLEDHCFIEFNTMSELDSFIKHFDGYSINEGTKITRMYARDAIDSDDGSRPCTRLIVSNFGRNIPTERDLYFLFYQYGFIKHISVKPEQAFVDFDTVEDAKSVLEEMSKNPSFEYSIRYAESAPRTEWGNTVMPLTDFLPPKHPFWRNLVSFLQDTTPRF